jgi:hypothetical protein
VNRPLAVVTGAACLLAVAACSSPSERTARAPADPGPHPVVAVPQAERILDSVDVALNGSAGNPAAAGARIAGPYKQILAVRKPRPSGTAAPTATPSAAQRTRLVIPLGGGWPRFFVAVTTLPNQPTPMMRVLVSASPRTPYGLWGELTMLPGATLPEVAPAEEGAPAATRAPGSTRPAPADALARYADVLAKGSASRNAKQFAPSVFTDQVTASSAADRRLLAKVATVTTTHTVVPGAVFALATADGGTLVIGEIRQTVKIAIKRGSGTVKVSDPQVARLAGKTRFSKRINRTALEVVALRIPPSGAVTVVAAEKANVAITGS